MFRENSMLDFLTELSQKSTGFMPHGHCYLWEPSLVWLNVISDFIIFFSYLAISGTLIYMVLKVNKVPFQMVYVLFGIFVFACGITHIMEVLNVWKPHFWISGFFKAITAIASLGTAIILPFYFPKVKILIQNVVESAKMSALGEMAGGIAHEINNPIAVIMGTTEQLKRKIEIQQIESKQITEALTSIEKTAEKISKIISGLKSFSRNGENDPMEITSINRIIEDTLILCNDKFKNKDVELRVKAIAPLDIKCRSVQISQVILNLVSNALDAVEGLPEKWVEIQVTEEFNKLIISVIDSGKGIPDEVVEKMMNPFFTSKGIGKGTGLGLSISDRIVKAHGGKLAYQLKDNHTCFTIELGIDK